MIIKGALVFLKIVDVVFDGFESTVSFFTRAKKPVVFTKKQVNSTNPSYSV